MGERQTAYRIEIIGARCQRYYQFKWHIQFERPAATSVAANLFQQQQKINGEGKQTVNREIECATTITCHIVTCENNDPEKKKR